MALEIKHTFVNPELLLDAHRVLEPNGDRGLDRELGKAYRAKRS
jgi:hypothetical protein